MKKVIIILFLLTGVILPQTTKEDKNLARLNDLKKNYFEGKYKDAAMAYMGYEGELTGEEAFYLGMTNSALFNYRGAIDCLSKAVENSPGNTGYEYQLAKIYMTMGMTEKAESRLADILSREPDYQPALQDASLLDLTGKKFADAVIKLKRMIKYNPVNFMAFYNLSIAYSNMEPVNIYADSAVAFLSASVGINPDYLPAVEMLGIKYFNKGDYDHTLQLYLKSLENNPGRNDFMYYAALCYEKDYKYDKELEYLDRAITINPSDSHYWDHRGFAYYNLNKFDSSIVSYKRAIAIEEENPSYSINLAYAYVKIDSAGRAIECLRDAVVKMHPEMIGQIYCQIGHILYGEKKYADAKKEYEEALIYDPKNIDAFYIGAICDDEMKKYSSALKGYKKAAELITETLPADELKGNERYATITKRIMALTGRGKKK